ncbi:MULTISPECIES: undecaprenyl phosphate N,N'-diacetylbacillosamine 1-phosphate transferase [unclassified Campylobacter]|uniref:undecaprenyl phosphate N,N'-diacetylbacillosamine 1-phosphate transferase n=1 Tax=unclassified Campylobacter TaxID=2593542 RepID=UPI0022EA06A9|nr:MULTISPECIES: undecaprenyl phosphate N,N'-diacetylbacillosamine 1-phosphate transferase [unclassified Campylobacter]MDA3042885.1 undecaprenyl phosphate N,N'-diacetylbacillosamine 1-phosphate transferase [Campylobacter sp. JMF_09 ED2]MDA3044280.1 undecaprenyl phosphate N,N'-diacetylbacillosamine 1-phosphate transferase [Campylobacter sp. JMF_07 ED4]MDA3063629.1 undecaprenyl phosphate N,N'-diacetylbacillosamine 1-phosphate transferase [Campylobacter sp. JMF_11 EL3]MDA3071255.1 undecaprenyl pho
MYRAFFKRFLDFFGALFLIILTSPLMVVTYCLIRKNISKSAIFTQSRPGLDEKIFKIYKFKTMSDERDANGKLLSDELRLNEYGKKIRALSLDELPQLFNVLKGDMSFIGPRPLLVEYLPLYNEEQKLRHSVRPGITGLAQVNGRNAISWAKKFEFDSFYAKNLSFALDLKIALLTIKKVIKKDGVNKDGMATTEKFNGKN